MDTDSRRMIRLNMQGKRPKIRSCQATKKVPHGCEEPINLQIDVCIYTFEGPKVASHLWKDFVRPQTLRFRAYNILANLNEVDTKKNSVQKEA